MLRAALSQSATCAAAASTPRSTAAAIHGGLGVREFHASVSARGGGSRAPTRFKKTSELLILCYVLFLVAHRVFIFARSSTPPRDRHAPLMLYIPHHVPLTTQLAHREHGSLNRSPSRHLVDQRRMPRGPPSQSPTAHFSRTFPVPQRSRSLEKAHMRLHIVESPVWTQRVTLSVGESSGCVLVLNWQNEVCPADYQRSHMLSTHMIIILADPERVDGASVYRDTEWNTEAKQSASRTYGFKGDIREPRAPPRGSAAAIADLRGAEADAQLPALEAFRQRSQEKLHGARGFGLRADDPGPPIEPPRRTARDDEDPAYRPDQDALDRFRTERYPAGSGDGGSSMHPRQRRLQEVRDARAARVRAVSLHFGRPPRL